MAADVSVRIFGETTAEQEATLKTLDAKACGINAGDGNPVDGIVSGKSDSGAGDFEGCRSRRLSFLRQARTYSRGNVEGATPDRTPSFFLTMLERD